MFGLTTTLPEKFLNILALTKHSDSAGIMVDSTTLTSIPRLKLRLFVPSFSSASINSSFTTKGHSSPTSLLTISSSIPAKRTFFNFGLLGSVDFAIILSSSTIKLVLLFTIQSAPRINAKGQDLTTATFSKSTI